MARVSDLHKKWMKESRYRKAYVALEEEFVLASAAMDVRSRAGLTQEALARKMGTTQPVVARMEGGRIQPSLRTLQHYGSCDWFKAHDFVSCLVMRSVQQDSRRSR